MDFQQIFRICLPKEDVELIRFWGYLATAVAVAVLRMCSSKEDQELIGFWWVSGNSCCPGNVFNNFGSLNLWAFRSLNLCMDFHKVFRMCLSNEDPELIRFWWVSGNSFCVATILGLKLCGCFTALTHASQSFQDVYCKFIPRGPTND